MSEGRGEMGRSKMRGRDEGGVKNDQKIKVLRMGWPIVENVPTSCGIILNLFRGPQLNPGQKSKNPFIFIQIPDFPYFSVFFLFAISPP